MAEKPTEQIETAPDPEEDDLDDLDGTQRTRDSPTFEYPTLTYSPDVLDEFQSTSISSKPAAAAAVDPSASTAPRASGPGRPPEPFTAENAPLPNEEDLAAQLQSGMSNLISELDSNPDMQKQFEAMMQELIAAGAAPSDHAAGQHLKEAVDAVPKALRSAAGEDQPATAGASKKPAGTGEFSDTIRKTMARMQQSGDAATAAAATTTGGEQSEEDLLAQMMKELQGSGEGGEEDFNSMLMNMMTQLTNKEILYEPMKELHDKFPAWMEKNAGTVGGEDKKRYDEQQKLVDEIVARFERKGYADDNEDDREYIVQRMQKVG